MLNWVGLLLTLLLLALVLRLIWPDQGLDLDRPIEASDPRLLATLIGLTGGTIPDAAAARFALERFEALHGRKASLREAALVAGMLTSDRS